MLADKTGNKEIVYGIFDHIMIEKLLTWFNERVPDKRTKSIILHSLFWFVWLFRSFYDVFGPWGFKGGLLYIGVVLITQMPLVYFHLYFLVPKLLNRRFFVFYLISAAACVTVYSYTNHYLLNNLPESWVPETMISFIDRIKPNYDILEGVIVIILTYALKYTLIAFITQNELLKLQKEKLELELNALKSQVNPHFLFNTLNNLYSLTLKNSEKSSEVVLKLSDIMRYVLYQSNEYKVPLQKELEFIQNYVALQKIRYNENYIINFSVNGTVNGQTVAPLLLIDFIENAFKHGLDRRFNDGHVSIYIDLGESSFDFHVKNSKGHSDDGSIINKTNGIGLNNIKRRLELMYPGNYELLINDENETFEVNLKLQLK
jgi:two-component system, LytTR family, sensor kinase